MILIGDQMSEEEYFKHYLSLAMKNKISWHNFTSMANTFILSIEQFKTFVNVLLIELKKHKDQNLIKIKLEPQDFYNDSIAIEEQITNESISQEQHQQISIKKEFEIDEHPISEINIQSVSSIPIQNVPFKDKSLEPTIKLETFQEHISSDLIEKSKCDSCNLEFEDSKSLEVHQCQEIEQDHKCNFCEKDFPTETSLNRHVVSHYSKPAKNLKCDKCDKTFRLPHNLTNHNKWIHETVKPRSRKRSKFNSYKRLKKHMLKVKKKSRISKEKDTNTHTVTDTNLKNDATPPTPENDKPKENNRCEECSITFALKESYDLHMQSFHNDVKDAKDGLTISDQQGPTKLITECQNGETKKKKYHCKKCDKTFSKKLTLQMHVKCVHDKVKNHKCDKCNKAFGYRMHLKRHSFLHKTKSKKDSNPKNTVKKHTELQKQKCEKCNKTFNKAVSLNKHIMLLHNMKLNENSIQCERCKKWFSHRNNLDRHIRNKHGNAQKYKCDKCERAFKQTQNLDRHILYVHGKAHNKKHHKKKLHENQTQCDQCEKRFYSKSNLNKHVCKAHDKVPKNELEKTSGQQLELQKPALAQNQSESDEDIPDLVSQNSPEKVDNIDSSQCVKEFDKMVQLEEHVLVHEEFPEPNPEMTVQRSHLPEKSKDLKKCEKCDKYFDNEADLSAHIVMEHYKSKKKCEHCGKHFQQVTNLIRHVKSVHDKIKDFKCGSCDRGFSEKSNLKKHLIKFKNSCTRTIS